MGETGDIVRAKRAVHVNRLYDISILTEDSDRSNLKIILINTIVLLQSQSSLRIPIVLTGFILPQYNLLGFMSQSSLRIPIVLTLCSLIMLRVLYQVSILIEDSVRSNARTINNQIKEVQVSILIEDSVRSNTLPLIGLLI